MKTGRSLQEIAAELERQQDTRKDYIAPQAAIEPKVIDGEVMLDGINSKPLPLTNHAHGQFSDHLSIPKKYYDRMRTEQPELLAQNMKTWLHAEPEAKRMLRTLDGRVRGFLSPKYRPLDNYDLANVVIPALFEAEAKVLSAELTETRLYIKAYLPSLSTELPEGMVWGQGHHIFGKDVDPRVFSAIVIQNSDVGVSTFRIEPSVNIAYCTNLAILEAAAMKKYHVGRAFEADSNFEVFADETRRISDKAFWLQARDVTVAAFNRDKFLAAVEMVKKSAGRKIESSDVIKVVDMTVEELGLPESTKSGVLSWLAKGGDLSAWGLSNAITRTAEDVEDYEVATQLERAGGTVLALPAAKWDAISQAA